MGVFNIEKEPLTREKVRVCAFNVGNFAGGGSGTPAGTDEMYNKFVDTFIACNADIYMMPEWDIHWNTDELSANVFSFLKPYHSTFCKADDSRQQYMGLMNYSSYEITSEYYEWYTSNTSRYFIDNTVKINGKTTHLICVHFSLDTKAHALSEMQQVVNYLNTHNIETYIIGGDMNLGLYNDPDEPKTPEDRRAFALQEIALLTSLGAHSLQSSGWGLKDKDYLFNTVGHSGRYHAPGGAIGHYDNFIVSSDIKIDHMDLVITEASDHDALCVDLIL